MALQHVSELGLWDEASEICDLSTKLLGISANELSNEPGIEKLRRQKKEIVFLPYKASMWDSLESIWRTAAADQEHCNTYVVPIPYAERDNDGTVRQWHNEMDQFPSDVPVMDYRIFDLGRLHPDVIYIHNPYDGENFVTSLDAAYYSENLKKYTELLIYVPYYATSGAMGEAQSLCPAYRHVDYIVIQADCVRRFFDSSVPAKKLLSLGSPKFDRVVQMCRKPPEPPVVWQKKMQGRKVYFYNTSLSGMLADTKSFLEKMQYVFQTFRNCENACLLWRPHPLLDSTFQSMRRDYYPVYEQLKRYFSENDIGIYDETPDIDQSIAWSDVYIGDAGTSVTALFGIAGKPLFILNNNIHELPEEEDWRSLLITNGFMWGQADWIVTANNKLYHSAGKDYHYDYHGRLSSYASGWYYGKVLEVGDKVYVCPNAACDMIEIGRDGGQKHIALKSFEGQTGAFANAWAYGVYLLLIPFHYPYIVRYDTRSGHVDYLQCDTSFFVRKIQDEWLIGGSCVWQNKLVVGSPLNAQLVFIDIDTLRTEVVTVDKQGKGGSMVLVVHGEEIWLLPYCGEEILCWNILKKSVRKYSGMPEGFMCQHRYKALEGHIRPFLSAAFTENGQKIILSPCWANMFVCLDRDTGKAAQWHAPFDAGFGQKSGYFFNEGIGYFVRKLNGNAYLFYYMKLHRLYRIDLETRLCEEIELQFSEAGKKEYPAGYCELSEGIRYGCEEDAFNSLEDLLNHTIHGEAFDKERQLRAYAEVAANHDGTSGVKIHQYAMHELSLRG